MKTYHKIQSVFKRDERGRLLTEYSNPEIEYLKDLEWIFDEKVNGTNIRVGWDSVEVSFGGRTDRAQLPVDLFTKLQEHFPVEKFQEHFPDTPVTLYGEGYGARIHKGGGNYISDGVNFVLFDVMIGDFWLLRKDVEDIATKLGIRATPLVGKGTIADAIVLARNGFNSHWGDFQAEGIVIRPSVPLFTRSGSRVITKLKKKDWPQRT